MSEVSWLMSASLVIWIGLAAYTAFLALRQRDLDRRLSALEHGRHA